MFISLQDSIEWPFWDCCGFVMKIVQILKWDHFKISHKYKYLKTLGAICVIVDELFVFENFLFIPANLNQVHSSSSLPDLKKEKFSYQPWPRIEPATDIERRLTRFDVVCLVYVFHYSTDIYRCESMNASDKSRLTHYEWERERRNSKRLYMKERECYTSPLVFAIGESIKYWE